MHHPGVYAEATPDEIAYVMAGSGIGVTWKELEEASKAIGMLGGRHAGTVETATGRVIVLEKASRTPRVYPRRDGEPKRAPLGSSPPST